MRHMPSAPRWPNRASTVFAGCFLVSAMLPIARAADVDPVQNPDQVYPTPDYTGNFQDRSTLLGDLGGSRQDLANHGITLDANLTQVAQGVVSGGREAGWQYLGRGEVDLNLDTSKMHLWPGGLFTVVAEGHYGNNLIPQAGTSFVDANALFPELDNSFVLPGVVYTQFLSEQFGLYVGKIVTITGASGDMNEFAHGTGGMQFLNVGFCFNPIIALTVPYSTLGFGSVFIPAKDLIFTFAVLDPHGQPNSAGFDDLFADGATFAAEYRGKTQFYYDMTGHQLLGATYSTSRYTNLDDRVLSLIIPDLPIGKADNSWAIYANFDQYLYQPDRETDRGIGIFARGGFSDGIANPIHYFLSGGVGGKGMIPGRQNDQFGIGYFYAWVSDTNVINVLDFHDGQGVEAFYDFAITPWCRLSPDIQWLQPSQSRFNSEWVLGARLYMAF